MRRVHATWWIVLRLHHVPAFWHAPCLSAWNNAVRSLHDRNVAYLDHLVLTSCPSYSRTGIREPTGSVADLWHIRQDSVQHQ